MTGSCLGEGNVGIDPQGNRLLFPVETVVVAPVPTRVGRDEQIQAAADGELSRSPQSLEIMKVDLRKPLPKPQQANLSWSMDFVSDGLANGRRLRCLAIVDDCTRECVVIEVDTSITGTRVKAVLERMADLRGLPQSITVDHGPEFEGQVLDAWAYEILGFHISWLSVGRSDRSARERATSSAALMRSVSIQLSNMRFRETTCFAKLRMPSIIGCSCDAVMVSGAT